MVVHAEIASTISQFVAPDPQWQRRFAQHQLIHLLVGHLALDDIDEENLEDSIQINKATSVLAIVMATYHSNTRKVANDEEEQDKTLPPSEQDLTSQATISPYIKARMKAMAARALGSLAVVNSFVCYMIAETRALMRFAVLLENGMEDVQYNSAMALMEITAVAEQDTDLQRSVFKPSSHAFKAIVDQLLKIIAKMECKSYLLIPCVKAIGNLTRTFRETRPIQLLVQLLQPEVCAEALISLTKFICRENYLHLDHVKAMASAGAEDYLVSIAPSWGTMPMGLQKSVLVVLCYIILDVPDSKLFTCDIEVSTGGGKMLKYGVLSLVNNAHISSDDTVQALVLEAKRKFLTMQALVREATYSKSTCLYHNWRLVAKRFEKS